CIEVVEAEFYVSPGIIGASNSTVSFFNTSSGAVSYQWLFGDGESSSAIEPTHTYSTSLQTGYIATLITTSQAGCTDTASSPIQYEEQLIFYIPNSFTPDADEHNQLFTPVFTSGFAPNNFEMTIYNRWGELIFESRDHTKGWDGSYGVRGGVVQAGLYSWIIRYKPKDTDEKLVVNGFVNVLR
ncbi:MAG: gliding motility-associated C-terminal domain-containing protein, partial [Bacteroidetes bacterium]|nr:gliding motility-associated C-terminal domain-containing protein [Bacteroidota bacterium]